jgi:transposase, IS605 orfB family
MRRKKNVTEKPIPTITRAHKIRIYPNKHNQEVFQKYYDYQRSVWNRAIDERNAQYKIYKEMKATGLYTQKELNKNYFPHSNNLRKKMKKFDWEYNFHCRVRDVQFDNLCQAWDNYFNPNMHNHNKPKYKKKKDVETHKKISLRDVRTKGKWLFLPKSQKSKPEYRFTKIKMAQELRFNGNITSDFFVSVKNNKWYVIITVETPLKEKVAISKQSTGIDVNVGSIDYLKKDGENKDYDKFYLLPKSLFRQYDKIKYYSRLISKKRNKNPYYIHSKSYHEAITKLNNAYTKAYNIQEANLNNIVKYFFDNYNRIVIEDLDVNSMKMNKRLCKSLHRNAFGRFKQKMIDKAEEYDVEFILANRYFPSTQTCSKCGYVKTGDEKLFLWGDKYGNDHDTYVCYNCGTIQDRTENAILNLNNYGK